MGSEASIASIASITGRSEMVDLSWTNKYNQESVDEILLWASPCRYENEDMLEGNRQLLNVLKTLEKQGLITLSSEDVSTLTTSTLPKEERNGAKFYEHTIYLTVFNRYLKLLAQYKGRQLQVVWDYKYIVPMEDRVDEPDTEIMSRTIIKCPGLKWKSVKSIIEALEIAKHGKRRPSSPNIEDERIRLNPTDHDRQAKVQATSPILSWAWDNKGKICIAVGGAIILGGVIAVKIYA